MTTFGILVSDWFTLFSTGKDFLQAGKDNKNLHHQYIHLFISHKPDNILKTYIPV